MRSLAFAAVAVAAPIVGAAALASNATTPSFAGILGPPDRRAKGVLRIALGLLAIVLVALAVQSALALVFDPRYRDFPFAQLTAATLPFLLLACTAPARDAALPLAETVAAAVLALCALYIAWNETPANWQALWFGAGLFAVAVSLVLGWAAPDKKSAA
jgi:glucan 1,3-beta-glucosidase